jgi:hypothetical protein
MLIDHGRSLVNHPGHEIPQARAETSEVDEVRFVAHLDGLLTARWLPSVHADAVRWWQKRSVAVPRAHNDLRLDR